MNTLKALDWYKSSSEFMQVCADAKRQAKGEGDEQFAHDIFERARDHGLNTFLTERQVKNLCRIADHVMPPRRTASAGEKP